MLNSAHVNWNFCLDQIKCKRWSNYGDGESPNRPASHNLSPWWIWNFLFRTFWWKVNFYIFSFNLKFFKIIRSNEHALTTCFIFLFFSFYLWNSWMLTRSFVDKKYPDYRKSHSYSTKNVKNTFPSQSFS